MQDELDESLQVDVLSAALRMDSGEAGDLLEFLAQKLSQALPNQTQVERGGWMLSAKKPVNKITVQFEEKHFEIARQKTGCSARVMKVVRGVVLKTTDVGVDEWTQDVARELFKVAEHNAKAKEALKR